MKYFVTIGSQEHEVELDALGGAEVTPLEGTPVRWGDVGLLGFEQRHGKSPGVIAGLGEDPIRDRPRCQRILPAGGGVWRRAHLRVGVGHRILAAA